MKPLSRLWLRCSLIVVLLLCGCAGSPAALPGNAADELAMREQELLLAPAIFRVLASRHPRISGVRVRPKRHAAPNELSRFRYDVVSVVLPPATNMDEADEASAPASRPRVELLRNFWTDAKFRKRRWSGEA